MKKDSARRFGTAAVIIAAILVGAYLLDRANKTGRPLPPEQATWTELTPSSRPSNSSPRTSDAQAPNSSPQTRSGAVSTGNPHSPRHPGLDPGSTSANVPAATSAEGIIVCQHPEHGTVYTNAASCEEADLDNRISPAEPYQPIANPDRYKNSDYKKPDEEAFNGRITRNPGNDRSWL